MITDLLGQVFALLERPTERLSHGFKDEPANLHPLGVRRGSMAMRPRNALAWRSLRRQIGGALRYSVKVERRHVPEV